MNLFTNCQRVLNLEAISYSCVNQVNVNKSLFKCGYSIFCPLSQFLGIESATFCQIQYPESFQMSQFLFK